MALVVRDVLTDFGLVGWPKTSGSRGMHIYCRIEPRWTFTEVRRAALALAREVERRAPDLATSRWWKEERHGVFVDYNQNAKDRTTASAYSVRPTPDARVSTPLCWDEVPDCDPAAFTIDTVPARLGRARRPGAGHRRGGRVAGPLLELAERHEAAGLADAPPPTRGGAVGAGRRRARPAAPTGRRRSTMPLIEIARAASKEEALAGPGAVEGAPPGRRGRCSSPADVLVDSMRGRSRPGPDPAQPAQRAGGPAPARRSRSRSTSTRGRGCGDDSSFLQLFGATPGDRYGHRFRPAAAR